MLKTVSSFNITPSVYLISIVDKMEAELRWYSNAFNFLLQKLGHSFDPPPHMLYEERGDEKAAGKSYNHFCFIL